MGRLTQARAAAWVCGTACVAALGLGGCGGGKPSDPSTPPPTGAAVSGLVFYDENGNGLRDGDETVRLAGVTVTLGNSQGTSDATGHFTAQNVPQGAQTIAVRPETLPSYFTIGTPPAVQVPTTADVLVPLTLPIYSNKPNLYLGFGDSITAGEGGSTPAGYLDFLREALRASWGKAAYVEDGWSGSRSDVGASRMADSLADVRPAFTLILYGTNDWNRAECKVADSGCFTVESLRSMIRSARNYSSMPIVATIPPVNPVYVDKGATERNEWVAAIDKQIRDMARQERVPIADVQALFLQQANVASLFADDKHPNDAGHRLIAQAFVRAITQPISTTNAASMDIAGFAEP